MTVRVLLVVIIGASSVACSSLRSHYNAEEYVRWSQQKESPLRVKQEAGDIEVELTTITRELEVARALVDKTINEKEAKAYLQESRSCSFQLNYNLQHFNTDIYHAPVSGEWTADALRSYLAFGIKQDIKLISQKGDTVPCVSLQQEALMSGIPRVSFLLDFGNMELQACKSLLIYDRLFNNKWIEIKVVSLKKNQQPKLTI